MKTERGDDFYRKRNQQLTPAGSPFHAATAAARSASQQTLPPRNTIDFTDSARYTLCTSGLPIRSASTVHPHAEMNDLWHLLAKASCVTYNLGVARPHMGRIACTRTLSK